MKALVSRRQLKKNVFSILQKTSLEEIFQDLESHKDHRLLNPLFIALCHPVELVRWHAVCAFGWLVPTMAENDLEAGRVVMRRFLWSLNDESGGIGWGAPESMAEIMCHSAPLRKEYHHMLVSYMREDGEALFEDGNYLELPMLQRGLLWGVGRLCQDHPAEMIEKEIIADLVAYLESSDMHVIGSAIWCLGLLGVESGMEEIKPYLQCNQKISFFLNKKIQQLSIAELAKSALKLTVAKTV